MMTGDPHHPEDSDPSAADPTLQLLQALARQQQAQPDAPLDRRTGYQGPVESEAAPPPGGRRRVTALLPSRSAMLAIAALLVVAVAAAAAASLWWRANQTPPPEIADVLAKAMAECDVEAAKSPDALNFLVMPLKPGPFGIQNWTSTTLQQIGSSYLLLSSEDALAGLRDGSLLPYPGQYAFSIVEPASGTRHSWPPTTGPTKFSESDAGAIASIKLDFLFTDLDQEPQLSAEFLRQKGSCYWVSVLVR